jgi:hypothetical protein
MTYSSPGSFIIDHRGGRRCAARARASFVRAAVERAQGKREAPVMPFARSVFEKTPEYADVMVK